MYDPFLEAQYLTSVRISNVLSCIRMDIYSAPN
jgi:hypothetical protein